MTARVPRLAAAVLAAVLATGCSASPTLPALVTAERAARTDDVDGSLAAYREAQVTCQGERVVRKRRAACADALLGEAEELERAGRPADAIVRYLAIPARAGTDRATAATALYRAGDLMLRAEPAETRQTEAAVAALWRAVTAYPDEGSAADALRRLLELERGRDATTFAAACEAQLGPLARTGVADNVLWTLADLAEHEGADARAARADYDRIAAEYPQSGLRDDARWHAARISRALGDPAGAVTRLRALLATREISIGTGSYFSIWLDDAQLELGRILRDDLHDLPGAAVAFRATVNDYSASILRDDALFELAVTLEAMHDHAAACRIDHLLATSFPDSKYLERDAHKALACP